MSTPRTDLYGAVEAATRDNETALAELAVGGVLQWDESTEVERHADEDFSIRQGGEVIDRGSRSYIAEQLIWDAD